jgi:hypothetical protein
MSLFEQLRDGTSVRLLTKYGDVFKITEEQNQTYNPTTGAVVGSTRVQNLLGKSFSRESQFDGGEMVETSEVEIYITASGASFAPKPGMTIVEVNAPTNVYRITRSQPIPESGITVLYRLFARR